MIFLFGETFDVCKPSIAKDSTNWQLSEGDQQKRQEVQRQCEDIYGGMAHLLSDNGVRLVAYAAIKVFRAIYKRIYINEEAIERVSAVVLLLLLSY